MSNNTTIIKEFEKLIEQIKYNIDNSDNKKEETRHSFRLKQTVNVLNIIKNYPKVIKRGEDLQDIKGVGKGTISRINEILKTGSLSEIKKHSSVNEEHINELEQIFGIGRKKAIELITKHSIKSIKQLIKAHNSGKIILTEQMLTSLKYHGKYKQNIPRNEITMMKNIILKYGKTLNNNLIVTICGSYRRKKDTSNDIDVLLSHPSIKTKKQLLSSNINYLHDLVDILKDIKFILDDLTFDNYDTKYMGYCKYKNNPVRRIDIYYTPYNSYYASLLHLTGSGSFNQKMRGLAKELGYTLNEYGLHRLSDTKSIKIKSEKDIFEKLGMEYVPPEKR